jgi:hypothetical protein
MPEPTLDWSTAEVKDSTLTVQVDGDLPEGWADTFNTTVKLLGGGSWGEIKLEEQKAEVEGLIPGTEDKLKHFLESVVQQANASHEDDEDEQDHDQEDEEQEGKEDSEQESDSDKEMSERFQSFAKDDSTEDDSSEDDGKESDSKGRESKEDDGKESDSKGRESKEDDSDDDSSE